MIWTLTQIECSKRNGLAVSSIGVKATSVLAFHEVSTVIISPQ